jgi:hypothetical protein
VTAQLRVNTFGIASPTGSEIYQLHRVSTPVAALMAGGAGLTNIFNDLADGPVYGSRTFPSTEANQTVTVPLNATCMADIMAASGQPFALGGEISSLDSTNANQEYIFGYSDGANNAQLILTLANAPAGLRFLSPIVNNGLLTLRLTTTDGSPITAERASRIQVRATANLALPFASWSPVTNSLVLTNGLIQIGNIRPSGPALFFRAMEGTGSAATAPLALLSPRVVNGALQMFIGNTNGVPLTIDRTNTIRIYSTTNLSVAWSNWTRLDCPLELTNGLFRIGGLSLSNAPQRFFRVEETP